MVVNTGDDQNSGEGSSVSKDEYRSDAPTSGGYDINQDGEASNSKNGKSQEQTEAKKRHFGDNDDDDDYDDDNFTSTFRHTSEKKRVPGRLIEKLWEPMNKTGLNYIERMMHIALNKTLERYQSLASNEMTKKIQEAQIVLTKSWLDEEDNATFRSRLISTKVPPLNSLAKQNRTLGDPELLNYDELSRRKAFLETYLSAEMKQLGDLEKHYNDLKLMYESDVKYLNDFKKVRREQDANFNKEIESKRVLKLPPSSRGEKDILIPTKRHKVFNPNNDKDISRLLTIVDLRLSEFLEKTKSVQDLNEKLELLYNQLEMQLYKIFS